MNKSISVLLASVAILALGGCSTKKLSEKQVDIMYDKPAKGVYKANIDENNMITSLCKSDTRECLVENDTASIYFTENRYGSTLPTAAVQCGYGSMMGIFALGEKEGSEYAFQNHTAKNAEVCNNRFSSTVDVQIVERIAATFFTFGTSLLTQGTMHKEKFDKQLFSEAVTQSKLDAFKSAYISHVQERFSHTDYEVLYIGKEDSMTESLTRHLKKGYAGITGAVVIDTDSAKVTIIDYDRYRGMSNISKAIVLMLNKVYGGLDTTVALDENLTAYIKKRIPPEVRTPKIPEPEYIEKSEYETTQEFQERAHDAALKRQQLIYGMQENYRNSVHERNEKIDALKEEYITLLEEKKERILESIEQLNESTELLANLFYLRYTGGIDANDMHYNADASELYMTLYSKNGSLKTLAKVSLDPDEARAVKEKRLYAIVPELTYDKDSGALSIEGYVLQTQDGSRHEIVYTDATYLPAHMAVHVARENEHIASIESIDFESYRQVPQQIVNIDKKEVWTIDVVERADAKVPQWYEDMHFQNNLYGFGSGSTLSEATDNAKISLAKNIYSTVSSASTLTKELSGSSQLYSEYDTVSSIQSTVSLEHDDYRLVRQEHVEKRWYVVLEYINTAKK